MMNWFNQAKNIFGGENRESVENFSVQYFNKTYFDRIGEVFRYTVDCKRSLDQKMICDLIREEKLKFLIHLIFVILLMLFLSCILYKLRYAADSIQAKGTVYAIALHKKFKSKKPSSQETQV